jgi:hypothetical protein
LPAHKNENELAPCGFESSSLLILHSTDIKRLATVKKFESRIVNEYKKNNMKQTGIFILIITICCCLATTNSAAINTSADSISIIPGTLENLDSISSIKDMVPYWDVMLYIVCLLILVPFVYIGYLKNHTIPNKQMPFHFKGEFNARNIIEHVEELEIIFGKKFPTFKKSIEQFDHDSEFDIKKHAEVINSILICIKLNGRKRLTVFWDFSDTILKVMILLLPLIGAIVILISHIYFGLGGLVLSLIPMIFIMPVMLIIFSYFLKFSQKFFRKRGKPNPALSLAYLAMEALINTTITRSFDNKTGDYFYYTKIHENNNEVNSNSGFSKVYVQTSSDMYGNLKEQSKGEK